MPVETYPKSNPGRGGIADVRGSSKAEHIGIGRIERAEKCPNGLCGKRGTLTTVIMEV